MKDNNIFPLTNLRICVSSHSLTLINVLFFFFFCYYRLASLRKTFSLHNSAYIVLYGFPERIKDKIQGKINGLLNSLYVPCHFFFIITIVLIFPWPCHPAYGILVLQPETDLTPPCSGSGVLTSGSPGNSSLHLPHPELCHLLFVGKLKSPRLPKVTE